MQPVSDLTVNEYCEIAQQAAPEFSRQLQNFCSSNNHSYIEISYEDFLKYENGSKNFRSWFEDYCKQKRVNPRVDLLIVGPCVKDIQSAERKTAFGNKTAEKNIDYLRAMLVVLKNGDGSAKKDKLGLTRLKGLTSSIETHPDAIAIKNYFWRPKSESGFRGHKSLWDVPVPENSELGGMGINIIAEKKVIYEGLMDTDKLTRKFMNLSRGYTKLANDIFSSQGDPGSINILSQKNACSHSRRSTRCSEAAATWGKLLYDRVSQDNGLSSEEFLNQTDKDKFQALSPQEIYTQIKHDAKTCCPNTERESILKALEESNILSDQKQSKHGHKNNAHIQSVSQPAHSQLH